MKIDHNLRCFEGLLPDHRLDREPFKVRHNLQEHPALSLVNLQQVHPRLPKDQVFFSSGSLNMVDDFDRAHIDQKSRFSLQDSLADLLHSNAYIMVRSPEVDPSFKDLFAAMKSDVELVMKAQELGDQTIDPMLYLFIASPRSITPFHIDRYSTLLLQLRGTKKVYLYPAWDERICTAKTLEGFIARSGVRPNYQPEMAPLARCFDFGPGEVLHIPFVAPHHVENGSDAVSISLSIIFNTKESNLKTKALLMNQKLRRLGSALPWRPQPQPIHANAVMDSLKGQAWQLASAVKRALLR